MLDSGQQRKEKAVKLDISSLVLTNYRKLATSTVDLLFKESFCQLQHVSMCHWELRLWCRSFIVTSTTHIQVISNIRRETLLRQNGPYLTLPAS